MTMNSFKSSTIDQGKQEHKKSVHSCDALSDDSENKVSGIPTLSNNEMGRHQKKSSKPSQIKERANKFREDKRDKRKTKQSQFSQFYRR